MTSERSFFLHVGGHKTATTALQKFLDENQDALRSCGIYWPKTGKAQDGSASWGHHALAWALRDGTDDSIWRSLASEIGALHDMPGGLVSSEEFSLLRKPGSFEMARIAMQGFSIRPIYFMRRQDQLLESIYKHHVKALGEKSSIMDFSKRIMYRLSHASVVRCMCDAFGKENVTLRIYDADHLKADIFDELLDAIGVRDAAQFKKPRHNINLGLSNIGVQSMLDANIRFADDPKMLNLVRQQVIRQHAAEPWTEHDILTAAERDHIKAVFQAENRKLAIEFFDREDLF